MTLRTSAAGQYEPQTIDRVSLRAGTYLAPGADPVTGRYYNQLDVAVPTARSIHPSLGIAMTSTTPALARHTTLPNVLRVFVLTVLLGTVACSGDSSTGPQAPKNPAGLYVLQQVDRKSVPAEIFNGKYYSPYLDITFDPMVVTVTGGEITLTDAGDVEFAVNYSTWALGTEFRNSLKFTGTYEINGDRIRLDAANASFTGSYKNGVITLSLDRYDPAETKKTYEFRYTP